ncbi:hypothetical protein ACP70R_026126 [Stipagrostis hirtigluma subsp. patula]
MALHSCDCRCVLPPPLDWDWEWELHALAPLGVGGVGDDDAAAALEAFQATAAAGAESPASSEASSGCYLQDAVAHWSSRGSKRQRMATTATATPPPRRPAAVSEDLQCLLESFWDSTAEGEDLSQDLDTTIPELSCSFVSALRAEEGGAGALGREEQGAPSAQVSAAQGGEEAAVVPPPCFTTVFAAAPLQLLQDAAAAARHDDRFRPVAGCEASVSRAAAVSTSTAAPGSPCPSSLPGKEKRGVGVLYPFAVVKPLGLDDSCMTTLSDVNQRIMKRPARPVRHPVGAFACGPAVSADGRGLSGKAVVSLTRIKTGGKGTITIIRTRG